MAGDGGGEMVMGGGGSLQPMVSQKSSFLRKVAEIAAFCKKLLLSQRPLDFY